MIILAQLFLLGLVVLAMGFVVLRYRQRKISALGFFLWLALWVGAATVIAFPASTMVAARFFGIGRGVDLVLYVSIILILYLIFRVTVRLEQMDRNMTKIVRTLALREAGLSDSESKHDRVSDAGERKT